jgi:N-formylmaleamate deformylase
MAPPLFTRGKPMSDQKRFYVTWKGIKLHVLEFGSSGPDVLLIPGITSPAITWSFVAQRLAENARVIVLDNRGRGLSDQRNGLSHLTGDYAEDAAGVIQELGLAPAIVVGHSMGARVAARLAATYPSLLSRCVLADPPVGGPGRRPYPSELQKYLDAIDQAARGEPIPVRPSFTEAQIRLRAEWLPTCNKEAIAQSHRAFHEEDMFADLPGIACPTLLLYAGQGGVIMDSDAQEIMSLLKNGSKIKIDPVGHMMPFDDLELFIEAVAPFIR